MQMMLSTYRNQEDSSPILHDEGAPGAWAQTELNGNSTSSSKHHSWCCLGTWDVSTDLDTAFADPNKRKSLNELEPSLGGTKGTRPSSHVSILLHEQNNITTLYDWISNITSIEYMTTLSWTPSTHYYAIINSHHRKRNLSVAATQSDDLSFSEEYQRTSGAQRLNRSHLWWTRTTNDMLIENKLKIWNDNRLIVTEQTLWSSTTSPKGPNKYQCYSCGKYGHLRKDCPPQE